jgi:hypothetical protein
MSVHILATYGSWEAADMSHISKTVYTDTSKRGRYMNQKRGKILSANPISSNNAPKK